VFFLPMAPCSAGCCFNEWPQFHTSVCPYCRGLSVARSSPEPRYDYRPAAAPIARGLVSAVTISVSRYGGPQHSGKSNDLVSPRRNLGTPIKAALAQISRGMGAIHPQYRPTEVGSDTCCFGGGGGNRTRVRKLLSHLHTCVILQRSISLR
jgi:hypothetical protein